MTARLDLRWPFPVLIAAVLLGSGREAEAQAAAGPRLSLVDPPGGRAGSSVEVSVVGSGLEGLLSLHADDPRIVAEPLTDGRFAMFISPDVPPGLYDLRVRGDRGLSAPRAFFVSRGEVVAEVESGSIPQVVEVDTSVCGSIGEPGDVDAYRFHAVAGQQIVVECWAERLDSVLHASLVLEDDRGRHLASNWGHIGRDPRIDHRVEADGDLVVRLHDLTYAGSDQHVYRLDIGSGARVDLAWPNVVERGIASRVIASGPNLGACEEGEADAGLGGMGLEVAPPSTGTSGPTRVFARPNRAWSEEFLLEVPGAPGPVVLGITDVPVVTDGESNHDPDSAQDLPWPLEVSGRLEAGDEQDWYRIRANRGEVVWLELLGERIGSPIDLAFTVFDARAGRVLMERFDTREDPEIAGIPTTHSDPVGRWVAPNDGEYLILVRNEAGGPGTDHRRLYRLSIRREEPDFRLLAIPGGEADPGVVNVGRGGRALIDVLALRRRGFSGPIRVRTEGLPSGLESPDVWLGPGVDRVPVVISADPDAGLAPSELQLIGHAEPGGSELVRAARGVTTIPSRDPLPSARLTGRIALGVLPDAPMTLDARPERTRVSQGSVVDLLVTVGAADGSTMTGPVTLSVIGTPSGRGNRLALIPAGDLSGWLSVPVPDRIEPGPYTFVVRGEATLNRPGNDPAEVGAVALSEPITIEVVPGAIDLELDPSNPRRIRRGEVVQIRYRASRRGGFIGKIHTELTAPGGVSGLRARGVTFVGQTTEGTLDVIASEDSPLGRQPSLRLDAVGTVEDEAIHHASCFLDLEIID